MFTFGPNETEFLRPVISTIFGFRTLSRAMAFRDVRSGR
jgi:hypothetical protein